MVRSGHNVDVAGRRASKRGGDESTPSCGARTKLNRIPQCFGHDTDNRQVSSGPDSNLPLRSLSRTCQSLPTGLEHILREQDTLKQPLTSLWVSGPNRAQIKGSTNPSPPCNRVPEPMTATEDLFTPIHKALRSMLYQLGGRLQSHDFEDRAATEALVTDLEHDFAVARSAGCVLCILHAHADDEEGMIFPSAARFDSELVTSLIQEHHDLTRRELEITKTGHTILAMESAEDRVRAGIALNRTANDLFAAYLVHMNREEAELVPRMKERFTNEQLAAMRGAIIGRMPPERVMAILGWMAPSLNRTELTEFLGGLKRGMPPPAFRSVCDLCASRVEPRRWDAVRASVGV